MSEGNHLPRSFARINKLLPQYNPKQIRNRYVSKIYFVFYFFFEKKNPDQVL
ncbi:hypothetical protein GLOIN_2v1620363 [Rhizophagus irregularis DAOM 181602=DAOM 197198]|nr:hypothetical protein GLOIN_2v1620363 [Rhizophagus irregularis DAOM 181602=DAOM 197198]